MEGTRRRFIKQGVLEDARETLVKVHPRQLERLSTDRSQITESLQRQDERVVFRRKWVLGGFKDEIQPLGPFRHNVWDGWPEAAGDRGKTGAGVQRRCKRQELRALAGLS